MYKTSVKYIFLALCIVINYICCDEQYIRIHCNHITKTKTCFACYRGKKKKKEKKKKGLGKTTWDLVYRL